MPTRIRPATADDAPALANLRYEFRASKTAPTEDRGAFIARATPWMAARLGSSDVWRAWIATDASDTPIGTIWVATIEKLPNPADELEAHAYVSSVFVRPDARDSGTGGALLDVALDWCATHGIDAVILWPTERSRSLYERHGFALPHDILARTLDGNPNAHRT